MEACRVFDINPASTRAKVIEYVVLGGRDIRQMAQAAPDLRMRNKYLSDLDVPITWYCCGGLVADQRNFLISKVIPELFRNQSATRTQIPPQSRVAHRRRLQTRAGLPIGEDFKLELPLQRVEDKHQLQNRRARSDRWCDEDQGVQPIL